MRLIHDALVDRLTPKTMLPCTLLAKESSADCHPLPLEEERISFPLWCNVRVLNDCEIL